MNGVKILSSKEVASDFSFNWTAFWILTAVLFVICVIVWLFTIEQCEVLPWTICMIFIWIFASVMFGGLLGAVLAPIPTEYVTEYKVYLENDVNIEEFNEKYEIIDTEGKIFTVRERD